MLESVLGNEPRFGDTTAVEKEHPERDTPRRKSEHYEQICLLGQPPLSRFLEFAEEEVVGGIVDRAALVDEWRAANDYYQELERSEAGIADEELSFRVDSLTPVPLPLAGVGP